MILRQYQDELSEKALPLLKQHGIAYFAVEMRVGKTAPAWATAAKMGAQNVFFFTKKKAISSIIADAESLGIDFRYTVGNYEQFIPRRNSEDKKTKENWIRAVVEAIIHKHGKPDFAICDESHNLGKFPEPAQRIEILKRLLDGVPILYCSGTPTPESDCQLYHQFYISSRSPFGDFETFYSFAKHFVKKGSKHFYGRKIDDYSKIDPERMDEFNARFRHLFLTYTRAQAGFAVEAEDVVVPIQMAPGTAALAKVMLKDKVYKSKDGKHVVLGDSAARLQQVLHQIWSGTIITESGDKLIFDSTKCAYIRDNFLAKGLKTAILYVYQAEGTMIETFFGIDRVTRDPDVFKRRPDLVFYSQIQSGREGVDLSTADVLIMFNTDFAAVSYFQGRSRLLTFTRTKPAPCYWLHAVGGIEQKIFVKVSNKMDYTLKYFRQDYGLKQVRRIPAGSGSTLAGRVEHAEYVHNWSGVPGPKPAGK